ncbi:MAG: OB-fold domain-containing protein [Candidatus Omnitrophica bacterium]|nr:OB-fold domain-containing protein [Candidatus Omnitrophota bacterium]
MIAKIRGQLVKKEENKAVVDVGGICYEINTPSTVSNRLLKTETGIVELVIYHYFSMDQNRGIPVMIGFVDELEKEFFEKFISISGIGPKVALKAFDKPISQIAQAIEDGDLDFLRSLEGIGNQKAKQIIATLQGKVGRFALMPIDECKKTPAKKEIVEEASNILRRLQYSSKEIEEMVKKALHTKPDIDNTEDLLNEIYRQRK